MSNQKIMPKFKLEVGAFLVSDKRQLQIIDREYRPKIKYKNDKPFTSNENGTNINVISVEILIGL